MHRWSILPFFAAAAFAGTAFANCAEQLKSVAPPRVKLSTTMGDIVIQLDRVKAPISTENFAKYVDSGHYDGTIFHRVIDNFMIQGGGISRELAEKPTQPPIKNEASNGLKNDAYTVAMARTSAPDSATAQFFINVKDNDFLNQNPSSAGYAVFGKVVEGKDVVDKIKKVQVRRSALSEAQPLEPVVIKKAECVAPAAAAESKGQK
jgi:peptidyl-prolyl cis-trans isomerase A (cyclophilin A)